MTSTLHLRVALALLAVSIPCAAPAATDTESSRTITLAESADIKQRLFAACPSAKAMIAKSGGYATFHNVGAGAKGRGKGVMVVQQTRQEAYVAFDDTASIGSGKAPRDLVLVFDRRDDGAAFFARGAEIGVDSGKALGAMKAGTCSREVGPHVHVYQLEGTKLVTDRPPRATFRKDVSLN